MKCGDTNKKGQKELLLDKYERWNSVHDRNTVISIIWNANSQLTFECSSITAKILRSHSAFVN